MSTKTDAARAYVRAFCGEGQAASDAAEAYIADDVDLVSPPLHVYGRPGIMERISRPWPGMGLYAAGSPLAPPAGGTPPGGEGGDPLGRTPAAPRPTRVLLCTVSAIAPVLSAGGLFRVPP